MASRGALNIHAVDLGLRAAASAWEQGYGTTRRRLAIVDFEQSSTARRLVVFDLQTGERLHAERVARGEGSGFSNEPASHHSSLGTYVTGEPYDGRHGRSLRLHGIDEGINDHAFERAIVLHGARYVSDAFVARHHRVGRSHGCFAVRPSIAATLSEELAGGAILFAHAD